MGRLGASYFSTKVEEKKSHSLKTKHDFSFAKFEDGTNTYPEVLNS